MICKNCGLETDPGAVCAHCGATLSSGNGNSPATVAPQAPTSQAAATGTRRMPAPGIIPRTGGTAPTRAFAPIPRSSQALPQDERTVELPATAASMEAEISSAPIFESLPIKEPLPAAAVHLEPTIATVVTPAQQPAESRGTMFPPAAPSVAAPAGASSAAPRKRVHVDDLDIEEAVAHRSPAACLGMYVGALVPMLLVLAAVSHLVPSIYVIAWIAAQFAGGLLLPLLRVTPFSDEDSDDIAIAIVLTILFGPAVGLLIYFFVGMLKQNINASVAGCLLVATLCRVTVDMAIPHAGSANIVHVLLYTMPFTPIHNAEHLALGWNLIRTLLLDWMSLVTLLGWISAVMFRKLDQ